ncbi:MAG: 50S ribosomal protein L4 [Candidatus Saccharimonadales bacterium]
MATQTFTSKGAKATTPVKLDKEVFGIEVTNHQLLKDVYVAYLSNGRENNAVTKTRGLVSGGGKKPWKQKGTGRARFGSSRVPIWRGGGITFGPTGNENYTKKVNTKAKRVATRQALSLANEAGKISIIEAFDSKGKVKPTVDLMSKLGANRRTLLVVDNKDDMVVRATRNVANLKVVQATYVSVFDVLNADKVIITKPSLDIISTWLGGAK